MISGGQITPWKSASLRPRLAGYAFSLLHFETQNVIITHLGYIIMFDIMAD
jgi:hypothetical protein